MLLFAGHDPGSVNHVRPLMRAAQAEGRQCDLLDLRPPADSGRVWPPPGSEAALSQCRELLEPYKGQRLEACVMGISTNSAELDLVAACRGMGVPTAILVDFFAGHRLEGRDPGTGFPDVLMYTNEAAAEDIRARYRVPAQRLAFVGSTYLESLVLDDSPAECSPPEVYAQLELDAASCRLLPFFVSPDDMVPDAVRAIAITLSTLRQDLSESW
eukprot:jgi/Tetstr1/461366/TSEL_006491.t2